MDYQPTNKTNIPGSPEGSHNGVIVPLVVAIVLALLAWYFWPTTSAGPTSSETPVAEQTANSLSSGDTTSDIASDLNNAPSSDNLSSDLNSLDSSVQGF